MSLYMQLDYQCDDPCEDCDMLQRHYKVYSAICDLERMLYGDDDGTVRAIDEDPRLEVIYLAVQYLALGATPSDMPAVIKAAQREMKRTENDWLLCMDCGAAKSHLFPGSRCPACTRDGQPMRPGA